MVVIGCAEAAPQFVDIVLTVDVSCALRLSPNLLAEKVTSGSGSTGQGNCVGRFAPASLRGENSELALD